MSRYSFYISALTGNHKSKGARNSVLLDSALAIETKISFGNFNLNT